MNKKDKKQILEAIKVKGKGTLNQKANIFADKRTKRNKTRQSQKDKALKDN